jgi:hypothetical protein
MESSVSHDCDPQKNEIFVVAHFRAKRSASRRAAPAPRYSLVTNAISSAKMPSMTPKLNARGSGANMILHTALSDVEAD